MNPNNKNPSGGKQNWPLRNNRYIEGIIPDQPYSELNFNTTLGRDNLEALRKNLNINIGFLNQNRQRVRHSEYSVLINYHQYALNILNNMINIKKVEENSPFRTGNYGGGDVLDELIYNDKGLIVPANKERREEWEGQFDANVINPPCYTVPPSNCFKPRGT